MMQVSNGDVIWDIGAGCGGVSVELARWNSRAHVYAIEQNADRLTLLKKNSVNFGVSSNCTPVLGKAPDALAELPSANKIFIGGSDGEISGLLPLLWDSLPLGGVLMATAVTDKTKQALEQFCLSICNVEIDCVELAVGRGELDNSGFQFNQKRPVMVLKLIKTEAAS
jgi:precorrin-6Y C5,15-methyltransferase (decarboxylating)